MYYNFTRNHWGPPFFPRFPRGSSCMPYTYAVENITGQCAIISMVVQCCPWLELISLIWICYNTYGKVAVSGATLCLKLYCTYTVEYRQSAPHRLSAPPPIFPHRKNWYHECAPPRLSAPPPLFRASSFSLSRIRPRPPSRYLASDAPTMHNEVPKCAWHLSGNVADYLGHYSVNVSFSSGTSQE